MSRLLREEDVYAVLTEYYNHRTAIQHKSLKNALSLIPTIDAEPVKHGHWIGIDDEPFEVWECDVCGCICEGVDDARSNYCPNCGAKMDETENKQEQS